MKCFDSLIFIKQLVIKTFLMKTNSFYFALILGLLAQTQSLFTQELLESDHLSAGGENYVRGMHVGSSGNTAVSGDYRSALTAGVGDDEEVISPSGVTSAYIAHYDEDVNLKFLLGLESSKYGNVQTVHMNDDNAIYATGDYAGIIDLDPLGDGEEITSYGFSAFVNTVDPFLAKYDSLGNLEWYLNPVETNDGYGFSIIPTISESVIWAGHYNGLMQFEFEGETVTYGDPPIGNGDDTFIFEVDSIGVISRHMRVTGGGEMIVDRGCYDEDGNLYLTGYIAGDIIIEASDGDYSIDTETMNQKFFILKIEPDWCIAWHITSNGESAYGRGVEINSEGDLVFAGYYSGIEVFSSVDNVNSDSLTSSGSRDIFMGKYSTDGNLIELYSIGGILDDFLNSMLIDEEDNLYLSGSFTYEMDFDPSEGSENINSGFYTPALYVAKYTPNFNYGWTYFTVSGGSGAMDAFNVGIVENDIIVAGNFHNATDFNPYGEEELLVSQQGSTDGYIVKLTNPELATSIFEFVESEFKLFPNPTQGSLTISLSSPLNIEQLNVYDLMGKRVYTKKLPNFNSTSSYILELPELSPGLYFLSLEGKETHTQRFIMSDKR